MKNFKQSLPYSLGVVAYVAAVAIVMQYIEGIFGGTEDVSVLAPMGFLLLLVVSVATMGILIFGKPLMLYIDGKKRDGVTMAIWTIGQVAIFTVLIFSAMFFIA